MIHGTFSTAGAALIAFALASPAAPQSKAWPQPYLIEDVRLSDASDARPVSLLLRHGRIAQVMDDPRPAITGVWKIDGAGRLVVPAFIDAFANSGVETPAPEPEPDAPVSVRSDVRIDMREANRKGIQPSFRVADSLVREDKDVEKHRKSGFGAVLYAPTGQLLSGQSALVTTREAPLRDALHAEAVFAHAKWRASGDGYPSTPMGYMAQLRQFFLDAAYQELRRERYEQGKPDPRPPVDADLAAASPLLSGERLLVCEANTLGAMQRWLSLAREFDLAIGFSGGNEAWRMVDAVAEADLPVFMTLDWGDEVDDPNAEEEEDAEEGEGEAADDEPEASEEEADAEEPSEPESGDEVSADEEEEADADSVFEYEEPLGIREDRRRLWEEKRDSTLRLAEAGVRFAFGTAEKSPSELLGNVRDLVEAGLDRETALNALTHGAASMLGVGERLGRIQPGYDATLALWTKHPLEEKAKVAVLFVDGFPYEFDVEETGAPDEGVDAGGEWSMKSEGAGEGPDSFTLVLEMEDDGSVSGTIVAEGEEDADEVDLEGHVSGTTLTLEGTADYEGFAIEMKVSVTLDGDEFEGQLSYRSEWFDSEASVTGSRKSKPEGQR